MSNEPLNTNVPFIDRLTVASVEQFSALEQYLQMHSHVLSLLRAYHELLALPRDYQTFKTMLEHTSNIHDLSSGAMSIKRASKVQFDENSFQAKHGRTFDASGEVKGFMIGLIRPEKTQVVLLDPGLSKKTFDDADELKRKKFARSIHAGSTYNSLAFVSEERGMYEVNCYFILA